MSESTEYIPKTSACEICGEHITQWRCAPEASYMHTNTGMFRCDQKFWTVTYATPKESEPSEIPIGAYRDKEGVLRDAWNGNEWEAA